MNEKEIFLKTENWLENNMDVVLAHVVETWGSSPRPVGSTMVINNKNDIIGSVSGGCIESFVFSKALDVIKNNTSQILDFGVSNQQAWDVGLTCGGKIKVFLEKIEPKNINEIQFINKSIKTNKNIIIATNLENNEKIIFENSSQNNIENNLFDTFKSVMKAGSSCLHYIENTPWFFKFFGCRNKVIVVGAVHIAEPLISMSQILGFETILIDPRNNYKENKFKNNTIIMKEWPDEALKKIDLDNSCALVTLTHDPKLDDPALEYTLKRQTFYIGCLGSKKTHASRINRLKKKGFSEKVISSIHGPIGLGIGAKSPAEIATSIISQIIAVKNKS